MLTINFGKISKKRAKAVLNLIENKARKQNVTLDEAAFEVFMTGLYTECESYYGINFRDVTVAWRQIKKIVAEVSK